MQCNQVGKECKNGSTGGEHTLQSLLNKKHFFRFDKIAGA